MLEATAAAAATRLAYWLSKSRNGRIAWILGKRSCGHDQALDVEGTPGRGSPTARRGFGQEVTSATCSKRRLKRLIGTAANAVALSPISLNRPRGEWHGNTYPERIRVVSCSVELHPHNTRADSSTAGRSGNSRSASRVQLFGCGALGCV